MTRRDALALGTGAAASALSGRVASAAAPPPAAPFAMNLYL